MEAKLIKIDSRSCTLCQQCVLSCPSMAIKSLNLIPNIDQTLCTLCRSCLFYCPSNAIREVSVLLDKDKKTI